MIRRHGGRDRGAGGGRGAGRQGDRKAARIWFHHLKRAEAGLGNQRKPSRLELGPEDVELVEREQQETEAQHDRDRDVDEAR
jgi:hypothetical protein